MDAPMTTGVGRARKSVWGSGATRILAVAPQAIRDILRVKWRALEQDVLRAMRLDSQNRPIDQMELFRGTWPRPASIHGEGTR